MCHLVENLSASVQVLRGEPNTSNGSRTGTSSSTSIIPSSVRKSMPSSVPVPSNSRSALSNSALPTTSRRRACDDGEEGSSGHSNRPKRRRMRSDAISNAGGQSTRTTRSVDSDICAIKNVTIPSTWKPECPEKKGHLLIRVTECASENSDIPGAVGIKHDLPAVTNPTNVTAVREELDKLYNAASSKVVRYSMLKNQCDVQCYYGIGRVMNELINKSAHLHSFINRAKYGESYQPHPTDPNLLQLCSKPTTVVSIAEGDVSILDKLAGHCMKRRKTDVLSSLGGCVTPDCQLCPTLKRRWEQTGVLRYHTEETCQSGNVAMCAASMKYKNTSKSSLHECLLFARLCPPNTKLAKGVCGIPASVVVKDLVDLCRLGTQSDRMYLCRDMDFVINGGNDALSAIHFVDGDSGFIVTDKFADLQKYSQYGSAVHFTNGVSETWIPFREAFHDAVEISHKFVVSEHPSCRHPISHDLGSVGHWSAMATLHSAKKVYVHVVDDKSIHLPDGRLIVTIIVQRENDLWEPLALQVIRNGVSFLTEEGRKEAPSEYKVAEVFAEKNGKGLYAIPKHLLEFTDEPLNDKKQIEMCKFTQCLKANHATKCRFADCMPWKLRSLHLDFNQKQLIVCHNSQQLHVTRSKANIHQSMVFVAESTIPNAGCGLFLRPHSTEMYFRARDTLCLYSRETLTEEQIQNISNPDYILEVRDSMFVDASVFHGWNLGRFVNQGGLLEGLKQLATDFALGHFHLDSAEKVAESFCNVIYSQKGNTVVINVKDKVLHCNTNNTAKELFVNYGLDNYWVKCISERDSASMDPESRDELSQLVRFIVATNKRSGHLQLNHTYSDAQVEQLVDICPSVCPVQCT